MPSAVAKIERSSDGLAVKLGTIYKITKLSQMFIFVKEFP